VHFTWFPRAQLKAKERALAGMNGRRVSSTRDYSRAQDAVFAAQNGTKKPAGCE
jgi:hypothetical protein